MRGKPWLRPFAVALVLLLAACGGCGDDSGMATGPDDMGSGKGKGGAGGPDNPWRPGVGGSGGKLDPGAGGAGGDGQGVDLAPEVIDIVPARGATNRRLDTTIRVTFSKAMVEGATENAIQITPVGHPPVAWHGHWSEGSTVLSIEAMELFPEGTEIQVRIGTAARDTDGIRMASPFSSHFTTETAGPGDPGGVGGSGPGSWDTMRWNEALWH